MPWKHATFFDTFKKIHWVVYECITVNVEEDKMKKEKLEKMDIIWRRRGEGSHMFNFYWKYVRKVQNSRSS